MIIEQGQFPSYPMNIFSVSQETLNKVYKMVYGLDKIYLQSETQLLLLNYLDDQQPSKLKFFPNCFNMKLYIRYQPSIPVSIQMDKLMITRQDKFDEKEFLFFVHTGYLVVKNDQLQFFYIFMMTVELQMPINIIELLIGQLCDEGLFHNCNFKRKKALHIIIYLSDNQYFMNLVQNNQQISVCFQILINRILTQTIPLICQQEDPNTICEYRITSKRMNKFTYSAIVNYLNTKKGDDVFLQLYQITRLICLNQQQVNQEIEMIYLSQTLKYYKLEENPQVFYLELSQNLRDTLSSIFEKSPIPTYHIFNQCQSRQRFFSTCGHQLCTFCTANYVCYKKALKNQSDNKLKQYEENIRCPSRITDHRICDKCLTREDIEKLIELAPNIIQFIQ